MKRGLEEVLKSVSYLRTIGDLPMGMRFETVDGVSILTDSSRSVEECSV